MGEFSAAGGFTRQMPRMSTWGFTPVVEGLCNFPVLEVRLSEHGPGPNPLMHPSRNGSNLLGVLWWAMKDSNLQPPD